MTDQELPVRGGWAAPTTPRRSFFGRQGGAGPIPPPVHARPRSSTPSSTMVKAKVNKSRGGSVHSKQWGCTASSPTVTRALSAVPPPLETVAWHRRRKVWGDMEHSHKEMMHFRKVKIHAFSKFAKGCFFCPMGWVPPARGWVCLRNGNVEGLPCSPPRFLCFF